MQLGLMNVKGNDDDDDVVLLIIAILIAMMLLLLMMMIMIAELWRAKRACGAPCVSNLPIPPVRPHQRKTSVQSHTF